MVTLFAFLDAYKIADKVSPNSDKSINMLNRSHRFHLTYR